MACLPSREHTGSNSFLAFPTTMSGCNTITFCWKTIHLYATSTPRSLSPCFHIWRSTAIGMTHYQSKHSYILELKYLSKSDYTEKKAQEQWDEAVEQINSYAVAPRVEALRQGTQLHKIIIQFCGWDMIKMREV